LLYDAYPIGDENLETSELQDAMNTQHAILVKLMRDDYPKIRILALQTVVRILIVGWDTILPATTTKWLKIWITHLSLDSSSPAVRQQAYIQLAKLIKEQDLAHPILNDLINKLSFGLHDVSDKVRSAFADVLLEVKETSIPYIEVSKIEMIMARVATEKSKEITLKLCKVISDVFFRPDTENSVKQMERLSKCLSKNYEATKNVFFYMSSKTYGELVYPNLNQPVEKFGEFAMYISDVIISNLKKLKEMQERNIEKAQMRALSQSQSLASISGGEDQDKDQNSNRDSQLNESQIQSSQNLMKADKLNKLVQYFEIASVLFTNIIKQAERELLKNLYKSFSNLVHAILRNISDPRAARTALYIAGQLPAGAIEWISKTAMNRLMKADDEDSKEFFGPFIRCIVSWQWIQQLSDLLCDWFTNTKAR